MASNHIMSQNISSIEGIASVALFASQAKQNGDPFLIHVLPSIATIKKEGLGDVQLMEQFVKNPSYGVDNVAYHRVRRSIR